jgi:excisionase family DNA binding protein
MDEFAVQEKVEFGPLLLRIREGESRYGIPSATLYEWAAGGVIPGFIRQGRSVRIHREIFEDYLRREAIGPRDGGIR